MHDCSKMVKKKSRSIKPLGIECLVHVKIYKITKKEAVGKSKLKKMNNNSLNKLRKKGNDYHFTM